MKAERPLKVVFFKTDTGNEPVRDWLKADGAICMADREAAG